MTINLIPRGGPNARVALLKANLAVREKRAVWVLDRFGSKLGWKDL
jgi:hypothetical protein